MTNGIQSANLAILSQSSPLSSPLSSDCIGQTTDFLKSEYLPSPDIANVLMSNLHRSCTILVGGSLVERSTQNPSPSHFDTQISESSDSVDT